MPSLGTANLEIGGNTEMLAAALEASESASASAFLNIASMSNSLGENVKKDLGQLDTSGGRVVTKFNSIRRAIIGMAAISASRLPLVGGLIKRLLGPLSIITGIVAGFGVLVAKNFDLAVTWITNLTNKVIEMRNQWMPVRIVVDTVVLGFRNMITIGKGVIEQFKIVFTTLDGGIRALMRGDFNAIGPLFEKALSDSFKNIETTTKEIIDTSIEAWEGFKTDFKPLSESQVAEILTPFKKLGETVIEFFGGDKNKKSREKIRIPAITSLVEQTRIQLKVLETILGKTVSEIESGAAKASAAFKRNMTDRMEKEAKKSAEVLRRRYLKMSNDLGKIFADSFGFQAADLITNIFEGADVERLRELNAELRETQRVLSSQESTNEEREAARERIKLIEAEIKAEKQRGNVILQTTKIAIEAAREAIKAELAKAIASVITPEVAKLGLAGLITAGIAIAGISALFASKVPKLAGGGLLFGRTLFEGGEYPGAATNPEVVSPLSTLKGHIQDAIAPLMLQAAPSRGKGEMILRSEIGIDSIIFAIEQRYPEYVRRTGRDPFNFQ